MYVKSEIDKRDFLSHINNQSRTSGMKLGQHKILCPSCQNERSKNKHDKPLSVNIEADKVIYHCHHCGINGLVSRREEYHMKVVKQEVKKEVKKPVETPKNIPNDKASDWLQDRGISITAS